MCGIALRLAVGLGLHRDGTNFNLPPFETEMRRRLWWHICILDTRSAEDHGTDPSIFDPHYDTQLPLNVNDQDLAPDMKEFPTEHVGTTEMTFCLIRFEVTVTFRRLVYVPPGTGVCTTIQSGVSLEAKEELAKALQQRLEERYIRHCKMDKPIDWVSATVARLILAKMWLVIHHPLRREDRGRTMSGETKERLFETSIEVVEYSKLLESNENTNKWSWLFHTYMQWHAAVYLLNELITRPPGPIVDRAWNAVDSIYDGWTSTTSNQRKGMLWRPLRLLMGKAIEVRQQQLHSNAPSWTSRPNPRVYGPIQMTSCEQPVSNPTTDYMGVPGSDTIGQAALSFGIDLNSQGMYQNSSRGNFDFNAPIQSLAPDLTPAQRNLSDEDIAQWLERDELAMPPSTGADETNFMGWDEIMSDFATSNGGAMVPPGIPSMDWI